MSVVETELLARAQHAVEDVLPEGYQAEVLDGALVVNLPPSFHHGRITSRIGRRLDESLPPDLEADWSGIGVYATADPSAEYQIPDVVVYRRSAIAAARLIATDVEAVVEVVSPANRRNDAYVRSVVDRAVRYGIGWVLFVDADTRMVRWFHEGQPDLSGPAWARGLDAADLLP